MLDIRQSTSFPALGTSEIMVAVHPGNRFCELVTAVRALDVDEGIVDGIDHSLAPSTR